MASNIAWVKDMRRQFSPKDLCSEDGEINQDFFKPKRIVIQLTDDKKWGNAERDALYHVRGAGLTPSALPCPTTPLIEGPAPPPLTAARSLPPLRTRAWRSTAWASGGT